MSHVLRVNPRSDSAFVALVDRIDSEAAGPEVLEQRLRDTHPEAVVRPRGLSGESIEVWYVYRDGHWTDSAPPGD
jgi:hypothetical protein